MLSRSKNRNMTSSGSITFPTVCSRLGFQVCAPKIGLKCQIQINNKVLYSQEYYTFSMLSMTGCLVVLHPAEICIDLHLF